MTFALRIALLLFALGFVSKDLRADVGLVNHQGVSLDTRSLSYRDETGRPVLIDGYLHKDRPVLLALVYFGCPGVCTVLLNELTSTLKELAVEPGRAFEVVVVSIDPSEKPSLALQKKAGYLLLYGRPSTSAGWHFLTGDSSSIASLASQLGFQYERDSVTGAFNHPGALFFVTPEGVLSQTLSGVRFSKKVVRLALLDAAGGRVGTLWDRVRSICTGYLPHGGWVNSPERWLAVFSGLFMISAMITLTRFSHRKV